MVKFITLKLNTPKLKTLICSNINIQDKTQLTMIQNLNLLLSCDITLYNVGFIRYKKTETLFLNVFLYRKLLSLNTLSSFKNRFLIIFLKV